MEWIQILPGVYGKLPDPDQQRIRDLQAGGAETRDAYIDFLHTLANRKGIPSMKEAGAEFLLVLEGDTP